MMRAGQSSTVGSSEPDSKRWRMKQALKWIWDDDGKRTDQDESRDSSKRQNGMQHWRWRGRQERYVWAKDEVEEGPVGGCTVSLRAELDWMYSATGRRFLVVFELLSRRFLCISSAARVFWRMEAMEPPWEPRRRSPYKQNAVYALLPPLLRTLPRPQSLVGSHAYGSRRTMMVLVVHSFITAASLPSSVHRLRRR